MILKEILFKIKSLFPKKEEEFVPGDDIERRSVCGGTLSINKTHIQKVMEAKNE